MDDFVFNLRDKVTIKELKRDGRIISIWVTEAGIKYETRYFDNAEIKNVYFFEDELEKK